MAKVGVEIRRGATPVFEHALGCRHLVAPALSLIRLPLVGESATTSAAYHEKARSLARSSASGGALIKAQAFSGDGAHFGHRSGIKIGTP